MPPVRPPWSHPMPPSPRARRLKDIGRIDVHMGRFIGLSPICLVATADASGKQDVTPRGDPPGSFKVLDERTIALADRPGNNRLDTLKNLLENPEIALIFLIPGITDTVRVAGTARLSVDPELLASMAVQGKEPKCAIVDLGAAGLPALRQGAAALEAVAARLRPAQGHLPLDQPHGRRPDRAQRRGQEDRRGAHRARLQGRAMGAYTVTGQRARQMRVVPAEVLKRLYARSDRHGLVQTAAHLALLVAGGWLVLATKDTWWVVPALLVQGLFINSLFGAMHESVHYGSFKTRWMADVLAFFSGAAILNNAGFYRHYHMAHHRYTQDPARDPELVTSGTPRTWGQYLFRVSSIPFLMLRVRDIFLFPFGYRGDVDYIHPSAWPEVRRWGRWLLALYAALIVGSIAAADDGRAVGLVLPAAGRPAVPAALSVVRAHALPQLRRRLRQHAHHAQQSHRALPDVEPALSRRASPVPQHRLPQPARGASPSAAASEVRRQGLHPGATREISLAAVCA